MYSPSAKYSQIYKQTSYILNWCVCLWTRRNLDPVYSYKHIQLNKVLLKHLYRIPHQCVSNVFQRTIDLLIIVLAFNSFRGIRILKQKWDTQISSFFPFLRRSPYVCLLISRSAINLVHRVKTYRTVLWPSFFKKKDSWDINKSSRGLRQRKYRIVWHHGYNHPSMKKTDNTNKNDSENENILSRQFQ